MCILVYVIIGMCAISHMWRVRGQMVGASFLLGSDSGRQTRY